MPGNKEAGAPNGKDKEVDEVPLQPVGEGAEDLAVKGGETEEREDARAAAPDDDEHEDKRAGGNREEEDERDRDPRDMSQREKRERRRRARDRDRTELRYLRHRNEQLEQGASVQAKRLDRLEEGNVTDKISRIRGALKNADSTIIRLASAGEEAQAVEAQNLKSNLEAQLRAEEARLADIKGQNGSGKPAEERGEAERQEPRKALPPKVRRNLEDWMERNPWFDNESPDTNSRVAMALDQDVMADGYDPSDPDYYKELDRRVADYLPNIAKRNRSRDDRDDDRRDERRSTRDRDADDDRDDRRETRNGGRDRDEDRRGGDRDADRDRGGNRREARGPTFRVGGRERPLKENEVYLTKERRRALEEMGAMEDPVLRARYLKSFKKYDEEHPEAHRRDR